VQNGENSDALSDDDDPPGEESNNRDAHSDNDDDEFENISAEDVVLQNYHQVQESKIRYEAVTSSKFATKDFMHVAQVAMERYVLMKNACSVGHSVPMMLLKMVLSFALVSCSDAITINWRSKELLCVTRRNRHRLHLKRPVRTFVKALRIHYGP